MRLHSEVLGVRAYSSAHRLRPEVLPALKHEGPGPRVPAKDSFPLPQAPLLPALSVTSLASLWALYQLALGGGEEEGGAEGYIFQGLPGRMDSLPLGARPPWLFHQAAWPRARATPKRCSQARRAPSSCPLPAQGFTQAKHPLSPPLTSAHGALATHLPRGRFLLELQGPFKLLPPLLYANESFPSGAPLRPRSLGPPGVGGGRAQWLTF